MAQAHGARVRMAFVFDAAYGTVPATSATTPKAELTPGSKLPFVMFAANPGFPFGSSHRQYSWGKMKSGRR